MANYNTTPEPLPPSNGDIAVQIWAEACYGEELERLARFLGKQTVEEPHDG